MMSEAAGGDGMTDQPTDARYPATEDEYGAWWLRGADKTVSAFGERAAALLHWWACGIYHVARDALRADWSKEGHIVLTLRCDGWATFDGDALTRLVLGAHERCIRVEIEPVAPHLMRLYLHPRGREGGMSRRHPTMEQALAMVRGQRTEAAS